jgi:rhodanese-related sulfurtransferase
MSAPPRITKEAVKLRLDGPPASLPVIIDVRLKYPYEHSTITLPRAIRMMPDALDPSALPRDVDLVLYDSDPEELVASRAAAALTRQGFRAYVLQGGIAEWAAGKLPTDSKPAPQPAAAPTGSLKG